MSWNENASDQAACIAAGLTVAQVSMLLGKIYQGPLEPRPWAEALDAIRQLMKSKHATLILRPPSPDRPGLLLNMSEGGSYAPDIASYNNYYYSLDPFINLPPDRVITADKYFGTNTWLLGKLYLECLEPMDIRYILGADLRTADGVECRFRLCRGHDADDFSARDEAMCTVLLPHIRRAVDLHSRLDVVTSERVLYENAIDRLLIGMAVFDETGTITKLNAAARKILDEKDGICLSGGKFEFEYADDRARFRELLQHVNAPGSSRTSSPPTVEAMSIIRPSRKSTLGLLIRAIPTSEWSEENKWRPACVVFLRDSDCKPQASHEILLKLFDLTRAESAIALMMVNGFTLDEAAEDLGVSKNTARAHLRAIFVKTGVTRQAELIRVLLTSVLSLS